MDTSQLDPQTSRTLKHTLRVLDTEPHTLPELGGSPRAKELFRAMMDGCPERGAEFIRATGSEAMTPGQLEACAGHEAVYEHPEALSALFVLAKESHDKIHRLARVAIRKMSMNGLTAAQVEACARVMKEHGALAGPSPVNALVTHMSDDQLMGEGQERLERATYAWMQVTNSLVEHGMNLEAQGPYPSALVLASIFIFMDTSVVTDTNENLPINVLIRAGADWKAALDDPRMGDVARTIIENHPLVRSHRLAELALGQGGPARVARTRNKM